MLRLRREWISLLLRQLLSRLMSGSRRITGIEGSSGDSGSVGVNGRAGWAEGDGEDRNESFVRILAFCMEQQN